MDSWHSRPQADLFQELDARPGGLTRRQAEERLARYGPNQLEPPRRPGLLSRVMAQMKDPMILVLLGAAGLSLAASRGEDWLDAAIILVIVVVNNIISISQEDHAHRALEELRKMTSPHATALRGGAPVRVEAAELVPGDVILLEAGDLVPADARLLEAAGLRCDESAMTGESVPVEKAAGGPLPEDAPFFVKDYYDYYKTERGYTERSLNSNQGWNVTSSLSFLNMPILRYTSEIRSAVLVIHGDKAHSCYFSKDAFADMVRGNPCTDNKELLLIPGAVHTDLYDRKDIIPFDKVQQFFQTYLK